VPTGGALEKTKKHQKIERKRKEKKRKDDLLKIFGSNREEAKKYVFLPSRPVKFMLFLVLDCRKNKQEKPDQARPGQSSKVVVSKPRSKPPKKPAGEKKPG
jgi:hypothetical protein